MIYKVLVEFPKNSSLKLKENQINIGIKSKPIKGKVNKEIIKRRFQVFWSFIKFSSNKIRS